MKRTRPERSRRIVITGGHFTPALAVIKKLQEEGNWQILFIGRKQTMEGDRGVSVESKIIPRLGISFLNINAGRIQRKLATRYFILALLKIPLGFFQSFYYLKKLHPDVILSFGGYLAVPVVLSGYLLGVPVITHEQSVSPGLATRFISFFAKKIAVSWEETLKYFPKKKTVLTGNPIREEILNISHPPCSEPHISTIYVTGGNQGSHVINEAVKKCLPELLKEFKIIHQCGTVEYYKDYEKLSTISCQLSVKLRNRYRLERWFDSEETAEILLQSDLVVSRAGANIISELAFLGKPAILIPFPLGNEQSTNAKMLANIGLARVLLQEKLTAKTLLCSIKTMMANLEKYKNKGEKAKKLVKTDSSDKLIAVLKKCLKLDKENIFS